MMKRAQIVKVTLDVMNHLNVLNAAGCYSMNVYKDSYKNERNT